MITRHFYNLKSPFLKINQCSIKATQSGQNYHFYLTRNAFFLNVVIVHTGITDKRDFPGACPGLGLEVSKKQYRDDSGGDRYRYFLIGIKLGHF